ncbi:FAD-binding domain-containing protein [Aspergillus californicus]
MHFPSVLAIAACAPGIRAAVAPRVDLASILQDQSWSGATLSFPGSDNFTDATLRWNIYNEPTYSAALSVASEADVVKAVKLARKYNVPFLATNGRHGYTGTLENLQNGLAIDLSALDSIVVDADAQTVTVGPGVKIGQVYDPIYEAGFQLPTGTCSCVGVIGATIGAGIGRLDGTSGLMIDALASVRVVTATGKIVEASETNNADLFWGIRGAGANFGIITSATYNLSPQIGDGTYVSVDYIFSAAQNVSFYKALEALEVNAKLAVASRILYNPDANETQIISSFVYAGQREETLDLISSITAVGPIFTNITDLRWNTLGPNVAFQGDAAGCIKNNIRDFYGVNIRTLNADTWSLVFDKFAAYLESNPAGVESGIAFETWPNTAAVAVDDDTTAYPWRETSTYIMIQFTWDPTSADAASIETISNDLGVELRADLVSTAGWDDLTVYVNYAHGDETLEQMYGANKLPRLAKLKKKYDPNGLFNFSNPLPTKYP